MNDTFILNVNKLYRNKTYLEKYGHSVAITVIILLAFFLVFSYFYIRANLEPIKKDWNNLKCHPGIIPFAGMINKDPNDTVFESTGKNFNLCTNLILKTVVEMFTKPVTSAMSTLNATFKKILSSGGTLQKVTAGLFEKIQKMIKYFINRLSSVIIPVQKMFINIKDTMKKMNGIIDSDKIFLEKSIAKKERTMDDMEEEFKDMINSFTQKVGNDVLPETLYQITNSKEK